MTISAFIDRHFHHFNAGALKRAAQGYKTQLEWGNKMMVTIAGAMSTARLGISMAEMIRQDKIHAICCTGANLEEDLFRLIGDHRDYVDLNDWRDITSDSEKIHDNRVLDTAIPSMLITHIESRMKVLWRRAWTPKFPQEYFYDFMETLSETELERAKDSWLYAAYKKDLPIFVPGWEDSTMGNVYAALTMTEMNLRSIMRHPAEQTRAMIDWYTDNTKERGIGFFQIGGGIAGDYPICVVPLIEQCLQKDVAKWSYFCQVSDSVTSYGSYSGALPNEKISWGKLEVDTPKHIIESDATIVVPLVFAYVMGE